MNDMSLTLSAYLDGELSEQENHVIGDLIDTDPEIAAEYQALIAANEFAMVEYDNILTDQIPSSLIDQIQNADLDYSSKPMPIPANSNFSFRSMAAGLGLLIAGGIGGFVLNEMEQPVIVTAQATTWLQQVADYHGVYAGQKRHLVEVAASESDHIVKWLSNTTKVPFAIPDISQSGFEFQGARLLVVKGRPVAQLMYKNVEGSIIAICFQDSGNMNMSAKSEFNKSNINGFDIISWSDREAQFLVIGDESESRLKDIADSVKLSI